MSVCIMLVGLLSLFIVGYPITFMVFQDPSESEFSRMKLWALSPFTGYALITGILKLLISFDVSVKYSAYPFLIIFIIIFVLFCVWCKRKNFNILPPLPFWLLIIAIVVLFSIPYFVIGAKYYRGYGWWDMFFYGTQAEFLKESPFSSLDVLCNTQPYLGAVRWYFNGCHRISRGTIQAFVAAICGVDGASTLGFISIAGLVLVFCSLIYVTSDLKIKKLYKYLFSFFGSTVPLVVMTQMEGFVPVCLFMSFAAVFCKLFLDSQKEFHVIKALLAGTIAAAFISTLLDALYLFIGILAISCFYTMIKNKQILKPLLSSAVISVVTIVWNIPFLKNFMLELSGSVARKGLNFIFPFAYTQKVLNFTYYGTTLEGAPGYIYVGFRFIAVIMLIMGVCGLIMYFFKKHSGEVLNMLAVVVLPTVFMCLDDDYSYSFYKLYSLAVPLLVVGVWLFWVCVRAEFKHVTANMTAKWSAVYKQIVLKGGTVILSMFFVLCTGFSVKRSLLPINNGGDYSNKEIVYLKCFNEEWVDFYEELESNKDKNLLLVGGDVELGFWWSSYFGRKNTVYSLTKEMDDTYFKTVEYDRTDIEKIPLDCKIYVMPNCDNIVSPESARENVAAALQLKTKDNKYATRRNVDVTIASDFKIPIYSKIDCKATLCLKLKAYDTKELRFKVNQTEYVVGSQNTDFNINLDLKAGANYCTIQSLQNESRLSIESWELQCK